jgi:hypothetical protein
VRPDRSGWGPGGRRLRAGRPSVRTYARGQPRGQLREQVKASQSNWDPLRAAYTPEAHPSVRVVVPAAAGSSPVAHPSDWEVAELLGQCPQPHQRPGVCPPQIVETHQQGRLQRGTLQLVLHSCSSQYRCSSTASGRCRSAGSSNDAEPAKSASKRAAIGTRRSFSCAAPVPTRTPARTATAAASCSSLDFSNPARPSTIVTAPWPSRTAASTSPIRSSSAPRAVRRTRDARLGRNGRDLGARRPERNTSTRYAAIADASASTPGPAEAAHAHDHHDRRHGDLL